MAADELFSKIKETYSYTSTYKKRLIKPDTDVQNVQDNIEQFRSAIRDLRKYGDGFTTKTKLERQLKKFIKSYNDMKKNSESISKETLNQDFSELDALIKDNEKAFKKIGIKISDNKLTFDEDIFEKAEDDAFDELFIGKNSFINQVNKLMRRVEKNADDAEYDVVERNVSRTIRYDKDKVDLVASLNVFDGTVSSLTEKAEKVKDGTMEAADTGVIKEYLSQFCDYYNVNVINRSDVDTSNNLEKIKNLCEENESALSLVGITFGAEDGKMTFTDSVNFADSQFKDAYLSLFGDNADFRNSISVYCKNIFQAVINPDKFGVTIKDASIIDQYA